ncbi:hypothetical protein BD410DRAFT_36200 [Rickenella mellea]|uniref:Uncharacterized protein n=1 Tax=Rickenella mellea TaxID=50990 RepID=A0A4R5XHF4_9AGAM|nr:hypothetical protein BD410DRAFT_36200 [Rickenella mellea]
MTRPGPLKDLPLAKFVVADSNSLLSPAKSTAKRPLSPSIAFFSPTKRRLLNEEGCLSGLSPRRSPSRGHPAMLDFSEPRSPARKLEFTSASSGRDFSAPLFSPDTHIDGNTTPTSKTTSSSHSKLAPSPEFVSHGKKRRLSVSLDVITAPPASSSNVIMVQREMPPSPDRQNQHYPGFDVYRDRHIELPSNKGRVLEDKEDAPLDPEGVKENIVPRRKPKKIVSAPAETSGVGMKDIGGVASTRSKSNSVAGTPDSARHTAVLNTPDRSAATLSHGFTPGRTPRPPKQKLLERKQTMEREVDETAEMEDD